MKSYKKRATEDSQLCLIRQVLGELRWLKLHPTIRRHYAQLKPGCTIERTLHGTVIESRRSFLFGALLTPAALIGKGGFPFVGSDIPVSVTYSGSQDNEKQLRWHRVFSLSEARGRKPWSSLFLKKYHFSSVMDLGLVEVDLSKIKDGESLTGGELVESSRFGMGAKMRLYPQEQNLVFETFQYIWNPYGSIVIPLPIHWFFGYAVVREGPLKRRSSCSDLSSGFVGVDGDRSTDDHTKKKKEERVGGEGLRMSLEFNHPVLGQLFAFEAEFPEEPEWFLEDD